MGFGVVQDFGDPAAASSRESVILRPDMNVTGSMKVVREAEVSTPAQTYTPQP
jgi:hypothetical protein